MKKNLILILVLAVNTDIFANTTQYNWRWRNDNGSETAATWKAGEKTQVTLTSTNEVVRLRVGIVNNNTFNQGVNTNDVLEYATSTSGPWTTLLVTASSNAFMIANTSAFVVQDEPTTTQLTHPAYTFVPGKVMVTSNGLNYTLLAGEQTEIEWAIRGTVNTLPNTVYYFQQFGDNSTVPDVSAYATLITAGVLPVKFTGFTANREDKKIRLEWETASEQNTDRFEVQRSSDGRTWKTIAGIKGHGTTSTSNAYRIYDDRPLSGINYYEIKQYDVDNRSYLSDVRTLKMLTDPRSVISVLPNPTHSDINFSIVNKGAVNVEAILTDLNGSTIHREIIKSVPANAVIKLKLLQQPAPGMYILRLKAEDVSENVRVIIE